MHTQVVQATQASVYAFSDLESSIFLQLVWLASDSIGSTPTRQPSLKVFGVARLAGLKIYPKLKVVSNCNLPMTEVNGSMIRYIHTNW